MAEEHIILEKKLNDGNILKIISFENEHPAFIRSIYQGFIRNCYLELDFPGEGKKYLHPNLFNAPDAYSEAQTREMFATIASEEDYERVIQTYFPKLKPATFKEKVKDLLKRTILD